MTAAEWVTVPGFPEARMVDSETHPPIFAIDVEMARKLREDFVRTGTSLTKPQVRPHAENRTSRVITGQLPVTLTGDTPDEPDASEGFLDNFPEPAS